MNKVTQSDINSLVATKGSPVLSLYLPTHKGSAPTTIHENQARYQAIVAKGLAQWQAVVGTGIVEAARQQLEALGVDRDFWSETDRGLAIFVRENDIQTYHLPIECDEYTYVGDSFDVTPLHIIQSKEQPFYLLILAKHDPKLFYGDSYNLQPVAIDLPASAEDALNKYLRSIDNKILKSELVDQNLPLIVAATDTEASDFRRISHNPRLLHTSVQGNHTVTPMQDLHELAWKVITKEVVGASVMQLVERFGEDKGRQKASSDVANINEAISSGRVHTLLVGIIENINDSVSDTSKSPTSLLRLQKDYLSHHLRELARLVVAQGGAIVGVNSELLASPTQVAALYRY